ncbi:phosphoethanolamine--lipid A transferase [Shewanella sp. VB17]|uniref:phosphoethanolamine transferase n=1 Tax=Shewanella sp. VB17 TaxID=2739432 RepID=UPI001565ADA8|nr:phosphoethanolamine--lipid A transferase [Shewanella sp. VB17]NRD75111.1 phosphoethanolamine--lipid A transferase [Shewanella sp. VB17]
MKVVNSIKSLTPYSQAPWRDDFNKLSQEVVISLLAIYFAVVLNFPFNQEIYQLAGQGKLLFSLTPVLLLTGGFLIVFSLILWKFTLKPLMIFLIISAAAAMYATSQYNVFFDYSMIENIFETNSGEAFSYVNTQSILFVICIGILPSLWLLNLDITTHHRWYISLLRRLVFIIIGIFIIAITALFFYKDYVSVVRNNSYLKKMINPAHFYNSVRYINNRYFTEPLRYQNQGLDATISTSANDKPRLLILVVGETARAQNMAHNGYARNTNPYTQDLGIVSLQNVSSCGTATAHSLPCMFSSLPQSQYQREKANAQDNVLDILSYAGVDITWYENDGGDKSVAKNVVKHDIANDKSNPFCDGYSCYDEVLVQRLEQQLKQQVESGKKLNNQLIALHTIGSHGPTYWERYPSEKEVFKPACRRSDIQNCTDQEIVNVYDNTLVYTDYILSLVITILNDYSEQYNVAMLYVSDHGESLGENGLYLHGTPYAFAPKEQTQVPWFMWLPEQYVEATQLDYSCLIRIAKTGAFSHDNLFHSLLGMFSVKTNLKDEKLDITSQCKIK